MSRHFKQFNHGHRSAKFQLEQRLQREQMGDAEYEKQRSFHDDRAFKIFGIIFILGLGAVCLGMIWLGA